MLSFQKPEFPEFPKKPRHSINSVIVGVPGKILIIWKTLIIWSEKSGHLKNSVVIGISGKTSMVGKNGDSQKNWRIQEIGGRWNFWKNVNNLGKH